MLRYMVSQRVRHDWATELNCTEEFSSRTHSASGDGLGTAERGDSMSKDIGLNSSVTV